MGDGKPVPSLINLFIRKETYRSLMSRICLLLLAQFIEESFDVQESLRGFVYTTHDFNAGWLF